MFSMRHFQCEGNSVQSLAASVLVQSYATFCLYSAPPYEWDFVNSRPVSFLTSIKQRKWLRKASMMFEFNSHPPIAIINQMANVQVFVIIIFLFVHSGETGRNNWGGSCKEEFIVKKEDIICDYEIQLSLFAKLIFKKCKSKKILNGGTRSR